jgi:hypothetical protein
MVPAKFISREAHFLTKNIKCSKERNGTISKMVGNQGKVKANRVLKIKVMKMKEQEKLPFMWKSLKGRHDYYQNNACLNRRFFELRVSLHQTVGSLPRYFEFGGSALN